MLDPYRWLEAPSQERNQFIQQQNNLTRSYLDSNSNRNKIKQEIKSLFNFSSYGLPLKAGSKYYYSYNPGLQNQPNIYSIDSLWDKKAPKLFLDVNGMSSDGTTYLYFTSFSPDNQWCVYGIHETGGDWIVYKIKNMKTGQHLNETLRKIKFNSPVWAMDNKGFFYSVISII